MASQIVSICSYQAPADQVLKERLKETRARSKQEAAEISEMVFAYFRWKLWLEQDAPIASRLNAALRFQMQFNENPGAFRDSELMNKAVPAWVHRHVDSQAGWVRFIQSEPILWLRAKPGTGRALAQVLGGTLVPAVPDSIAYAGQDDLFARPEFHQGQFEIQDIASQIVGLVCNPKPNEKWWDTCAGQGGKTLHLSALMGNKGLIWASDRSCWRLAHLRRRAARAQVFNYRSATWDGSTEQAFASGFDGVLVDAPCSGIGTWQRNPHARWTINRSDVIELAGVQQQLLHRVTSKVKPGGKLVYAVCTLAREETDDVADSFESTHHEFVPEPFNFFGTAEPTKYHRMTVPPTLLKSNGMFIAQWRRSRRR